MKLVKKIFVGLCWVVLHSTHTSDGSIAVGLSCNIGLPPMMSTNIASTQLVVDSNAYKLGFAPTSDAVILANTTANGKQAFYTQFHVNGYWANRDSKFVMTRFASHQPFSSASEGDGLALYKSYIFTPVDFIVMSQNIISYNSSISGFTSNFPGYRCDRGSLIDGALEKATLPAGASAAAIASAKAGKTQLSNYIFDACSLYSKCTPIASADMLANKITGQDAIAMLVTTPKHLSQVMDVGFFKTNFTSLFKTEIPTIQIKDYFNNDPNVALYIPLHIVDPATTNVGFDEDIAASVQSNT